MSDARTLVFATRNRGKLVELAQMFEGFGLQIVSVADLPGEIPDVVEDGETFEANAIKKAMTISRITQLPALADDSGLEVDALDGAPGVYSARYSGAGTEANNQKLVAALRDVPDRGRGARFRSVLAFADVAGPLGAETITTDGRCEGHILRAPRGTGGFGYDPLFFSDDLQVTFAEAPASDKNQVSHRARALAAMKPRLVEYFRLANPEESG